jgi:hypothetical protein
MSVPSPRSLNRPTVVGAVLIAGFVLASCGACGGTDTVEEESVTASPTAISGVLEAGAVAPDGAGPWLVGVAWFDEDLFDPVEMEVREEPEYWHTFEIEALPAPFSADLGAPFRGWVVLVVDVNGSGLPDSPMKGDLVGVSGTVVEAPATDLKVYLEEVWER